MKKLIKLFGGSLARIALAAVIVFSMTTCDNGTTSGHETSGVGHDGEQWESVNQGNEYTPIVIPDIKWLGDRREIEGNFGAIDANVVTTTVKNGAFSYRLAGKGGGSPYPLFNILWVESLKDVPSTPAGNAAKPLKDLNKSEKDHPGILFMWDGSREIKDNFYRHQVFLDALEAEELSERDVDDAWLEAHGFRDGIPDKDDNYYPGILKVHEKVFQKYIGFVLKITTGHSLDYYYLILPQRGQLRNVAEDGTEGDSYIFYIDGFDKEFGEDGDSIVGVYVEAYVGRETPDVTPPRPDPPPPAVDPPAPPGPPPEEEPPLPPVDDLEDYHPDEDEDPFGTALITVPPEKTGNKYVIISTAGAGGAEVDPGDKWKFSGKPIKNYWDDLIKTNKVDGVNYYSAMKTIKNSAGKNATWIWDRSDSWMYGVSGCFTVITASRFYIGEDEEVVESSVPFYFACDNAAAVYVNGRLAGFTEKPFSSNRPKPGNTSDWRFTGLDNRDFDGTVFGYLYMKDIKPYFTKGHNEILVMAANNDDSGGRWNTTNNPAGLLFASEFSTTVK